MTSEKQTSSKAVKEDVAAQKDPEGSGTESGVDNTNAHNNVMKTYGMFRLSALYYKLPLIEI